MDQTMEWSKLGEACLSLLQISQDDLVPIYDESHVPVMADV
jgi:hypothetical protein